MTGGRREGLKQAWRPPLKCYSRGMKAWTQPGQGAFLKTHPSHTPPRYNQDIKKYAFKAIPEKSFEDIFEKIVENICENIFKNVIKSIIETPRSLTCGKGTQLAALKGVQAAEGKARPLKPKRRHWRGRRTPRLPLARIPSRPSSSTSLGSAKSTSEDAIEKIIRDTFKNILKSIVKIDFNSQLTTSTYLAGNAGETDLQNLQK